MDPMATPYFDDAFGGAQRRDGQFSHWLENSPWDPMAINNTQDSFPAASISQSSASHTINPRTDYAFQGYRSAALPSASDCETVPGGDSGYGSLMPSNIDNSSIQGDDRINSSLPDVENELGSFHLNGHDTQTSGLQFNVPDASGDFSHSPSPSRPQQVPQQMAPQMCTECNTPVRTKSEMNKHVQRHKKPHTCSYPDCSRNANGFASNNDLVRHKRTVHGELQNGRSFVCHHDPCNKKDMKLWPRADNFRSHLLRVHKLKVKAEDDLRDYVHQQQQHSQDLEGIGTNLPDPGSLDEDATRAEYISQTGTIVEFPDISPAETPASHLPAGAPVYNQSLLMPPNSHANRYRHGGRQQPRYNPTLHAIEDMKPIISSPSQTVPFEQSSQQGQRPVVPVTSSVDYPCAMEVTDDPSPQSTMAISAEPPPQTESDEESDGESKASVMSSSATGSQSLQQTLDQLKEIKPSEQIEYLKHFPKEILKQALDTLSQNTDDNNDAPQSNPKPNTACTTCEKIFSRPSELRKHNKRHEKPYGCTWYQCKRIFGSKNDWKRHETNQHGQIETWHCPHNCEKVFNSREMLHTHLRHNHKITDGEILERNLEGSRQGSHCTDLYWCGFCKEFRATTPGENASSFANQRFDHIDDHFMGRHGWKKLRITEWQHMEEQADEAERPSSKNTHPSEAEGDAGRQNKRQRAN